MSNVHLRLEDEWSGDDKECIAAGVAIEKVVIRNAPKVPFLYLLKLSTKNAQKSRLCVILISPCVYIILYPTQLASIQCVLLIH